MKYIPESFMRSSDAALTDMSCLITFVCASCGLSFSSGTFGAEASDSWLNT